MKINLEALKMLDSMRERHNYNDKESNKELRYLMEKYGTKDLNEIYEKDKYQTRLFADFR